jgi:GTP-binding protein
MSFVDEVRLSVRAGAGGDGATSFHREKHMPRGGPDGGSGGRGGSVILTADESVSSLAAFTRKRSVRAERGANGGPNRRDGANANDIDLRVPVGTVVRDATTREVLADLARAHASYEAAIGGRGGRGNAALKSRDDRIPNYAEGGEPGQELELSLELHLVCDVGLIGAPNAGKSTFLRAVSGANPKIADYPFTTIEPGLGVVDVGDRRFVMADLPGLIEGAAEGKGLGLRFLRHAERCAVLAAVVDLSGEDPVADLDTVFGEVASYQADLAERVRVVLGNKIDLPGADAAGAQAWASTRAMRFVPIAAAHGTNLDEALGVLIDEVESARAERGEAETFAVYRPVTEDRVQITREDGAFRVRSERVERLVGQTPLDNARAVRRLQRRLRSLGVEAALRREGAKEGDEVRIGPIAFDYVPDDA